MASKEMELQNELENIAASYLPSGKSRGLVIAVVHGEFEASYCYGMSGADGRSPVTGGTIFEIGSITKVFTAMVLADMVNKGEVALHDPVRKYLPEEIELPSGFEEITLLQLATHTSGLRRLPGNLMTAEMDRENPYADYTTEDLYRGLATARLAAKPGEAYAYSNFGMGLLGHVLALAAGTDYEQLVKRRICDPLGMADTSVSLGADQQSRLAQGHAKGKRTANWDIVTLAGCGGLRSSGADMLQFLRAQVDTESSTLQDAVRIAQQPRVGKDLSQWKWVSQVAQYGFMFVAWYLLDRLITYWMPGLSLLPKTLVVGICVLSALLAAVFACWGLAERVFGPLQRMGLGWHLGRLGEKRDYVWHNGATGGYRSYMAVIPGERAGVAVLSNCNSSVDAIGKKALDAVTRDVTAAKSS